MTQQSQIIISKDAVRQVFIIPIFSNKSPGMSQEPNLEEEMGRGKRDEREESLVIDEYNIWY